MRNGTLLLMTALAFTVGCGGTSAGSSDGGDDTGGSGGSSVGGSGADTGGTGGTGAGGTGAGGTGAVGGSAGSTGGAGGSDSGCAGYGGVGGQPPMCGDGTISSYQQTADGYCHFSEPCVDDSPVCVYDQYHVPHCASCPDTGGGPMVSVGDSCVDVTEVTRGDYDAWLATSPSLSGQSSECSWNASFSPDMLCMAGPDVCSTGCDDHPQVCVDWCDASAYCAAVGKRLCGIYPPNEYGEPWGNDNDTELGEACDSNTGDYWPYGPDYHATYCNGSEQGKGTTVAAGSLTHCARSHADGTIFDTTGNVWEWEDACAGTTGSADLCRAHGGSYKESGSTAICNLVDNSHKRDFVAGNLGFRCCGP